MWSDTVTLLLIIIRFISHVNFTMAVSSWNMHDLCGANLDIYEAAGKLLFDANELPVNLPGNACELTITSSSAHSNKMMIMFYFTQFMFSDSCDDSNVKFINGASNNSSTVPGLPRFVCNNNRSQEQNNLYFTTSGKSLKIVFTKSQLKSRNVFTVVLVPYFIGSCLSDTVHECSNGRCIFVNDACLYDVNSCGSEDLNCYTDDTTTQSHTGYTDDTTTEAYLSYPAFLSPQLGAVYGFFLLLIGSAIVFCVRSEAFQSFLAWIKGCFTSAREFCCSCSCGTCRGFSKCFDGFGSVLSRGFHSIRANCAGLCRKCAEPSIQSTNNSSCPSNQSHQEAVGNHVDCIVTLQFYPEQSAEQLPPSYESVTQYRSGSEFNTSNDCRPTAPPVEYLSVEDPPPSYNDII